MADAHGHGRGAQVSASVHRAVWISVAVALALTLIGMVALWPRGDSLIDADATEALSDAPTTATVASVQTANCGFGDDQQCQTITLDLDEGSPESRGSESAGFSVALSEHGGLRLEPGDAIYVTSFETADGQTVYSFYDYQRRTPLLMLTVLFAAAVIALGRWRGLGALVGLAVSVLVLAVFLLPSILHGRSPVLAAIVASAVIAFVALYLAHGVNVATSVALLGTFGSLLITAAMSWLFAALAHFTGLADESAYYLQALGGRIDLRGIVLAGFVIGALGVLDDVTVTQVSAVWELHAAQPQLARPELFRAALRIGRDHISSTVNTLFLAYAGAALPLLLLFTQSDRRLSVIMSQELVATEIVRALAGSIGLVAAVPITTWLAVGALHEPALEGAAT